MRLLWGHGNDQGGRSSSKRLQRVIILYLVPLNFSFTYVQTALLLVHSGCELARQASDKNALYDAAALLVALPVGLVSWAEAAGCESWLRGIGGHVWYDGTICVSLFAYAAFIIRHNKNINGTCKEKSL